MCRLREKHNKMLGYGCEKLETNQPITFFHMTCKISNVNALKFSFPEKATKIWAISLMVWTFTRKAEHYEGATERKQTPWA